MGARPDEGNLLRLPVGERARRLGPIAARGRDFCDAWVSGGAIRELWVGHRLGLYYTRNCIHGHIRGEGGEGPAIWKDVLAIPRSDRVKTLRVGAVDAEEGITSFVRRLAATTSFSSLEQLHLGVYDTSRARAYGGGPWWGGPFFLLELPCLNLLCRRYARLRELVVQAADPELRAPLQFPRLETLEVRAPSLSAGFVERLGRSRLPCLRRLTLWLGEGDWLPALPGLLAGRFPRLDCLGLVSSSSTDAVAACLVESGILERIERLDLTLGTLTDRGAKTLVRAPAATVCSLDVSDNFLTPVGIASLKRSWRTAKVQARRQKLRGRGKPKPTVTRRSVVWTFWEGESTVIIG